MNRFFKKLVCAAMSAVMVIGYVVPLNATFAQAAINGPSFEFIDSEIDKYSNTIIEGTTAKFAINHVEKFSPQDKPFEILEGTDYKPYEKGNITAELSYSSRQGTIETKSGLTAEPTAADIKTFTIKGKFNVIGAEAVRVTEVSGDGRTTKARANLASNESLTSHSRIKLKCTKSQNGTEVPVLAVDGSPTGIFKGALGNVSVNLIDGRKDAYIIGIQGYNVYLYPELIYKVQKKDSLGNPVTTTAPDGSIVPVMVDIKEIQDGTNFDIEFDIYRTPPLVLNVVSPEKSVQEIADKINNPKERKDYIIFGHKDDNELYINEEFILKGLTKRYGTRHEIKWTYEVCDEQGNSKANPSDQEKGAILLPKPEDQKTEDIKVGIRPRIDDTFIKLKAEVSLKSYTTVTKEASFIINIRGTGTPPSTWNIKNFYDKNGAPNWSTNDVDIDKDIPSKLDMNDGKNDKFPLAADAPHEMGILLKLGQKNAASVYAKVKAEPPENIEAVQYINNQPGKSIAYKYGTEIKNPENDIYQEGKAVIGFIPKKTGKTKITIEYYAQGATSGSVREPSKEEYYVNVIDTSPSRDATLKELQIMDSEKENIDYGFKPDQTSYKVSVPNAVKRVSFKPVANSHKVNKIEYTITTFKSVAPGLNSTTVTTGIYDGRPVTAPSTTEEIQQNSYIQIEVKVTPQSAVESDCLTYTVEVIREAPSDNAFLKNLMVSDKKGNQYKLTPNFTPKGFNYSVELPFKVGEVMFLADKDNKYADYQIGRDKDNSGKIEDSELSEKVGNKSPEWYPLTLDGQEDKFGTTPDKAHKYLVKVTPENGQDFYVKNYFVDIFRKEPNRDATAKDIKIYDALGKTEIKYTPKLSNDFEEYHVQIPFENDKLRFSVTPNNYDIKQIEFIDINDGNKVLQTVDDFDSVKGAVTSKAFEVDYLKKENENDEEGKPHKIKVKITPESGKETEIKEYTFIIYREPPNTDSLLKSLIVKGDENTDNQEFDYNFFPQTTEYALTVPYETKTIKMIPTAVFDKPKEIKINASTALFAQKVESGKESSAIKLEDDKETEIKVTVTAQDNKTTTEYIYKIVKEKPSSDANLIKLEVAGVEEFKPVFRPSETAYTAKALEGTTEVTVKPTAANKHSTIWIGKDKVESGTVSKPINIYEEQIEVVVEVTAQDGKTKQKYIVNITNPNAIEKTSNADLKSLVVNDGDMLPKFSSSITSYNVAVADDTYSIEVVPKPSDKYAKVQVFQGSKEIGDEKNSYKQAIEEGENKFTVKVTSSDETKVKEYNVFVNKNVKDKEASFKPVTPDDVNFKTEDNIIVINVEKYPIVTSEVFIEMRDKCPEKTLVLEGNDYSLQFKGSDLSKNIPHQLKYDFKLFFETPEEDEIDELLYDLGKNRDLDPVYMYFRYHGALPGPCIFNINIGNKYGNKKLYMNYYNDERERIDYYGYVLTNAKGNFSVKLEHFSTYFLTKKKVNGAEDRSNSSGKGTNSTINTPSSNKQHPNTGDKNIWKSFL